jgi:flagellar P-ring protein precursor FlgI
MFRRSLAAAFVALIGVAGIGAVPEVRVGDVATVLGPREKEFVGVGLVTGLAGRGDTPGSAIVADALKSAASTFGIELQVGDIKSKNCAVVLVTAVAPPFVRAGDRISVDVASIGDAKGIEEGVLLATVLRDATGTPSAVAQGRIVILASAKTRTVGSIPGGAVAQRDLVSGFAQNGVVSLVMRHPDFALARAVGQAIRDGIAGAKVTTRDASLVEVEVPEDRRADAASFVADLEAVRVKPEPSARVVVDAARGVVVIGENVRIGRVAVAYRRLSVSVGPASVAGASAAKGQDSFLLDQPATVSDLVGMLQSLELKADDIIGILQAIDQAGALYGTLVVM